MAIQVWEYLTELETEREDISNAIQQVLWSGRLILGESVTRFEAEFAEYCGVGYGVGVDNGTNAISLGLRAIGIKQGDEVITVANTAVPTVSAIDAVGATARFVDIESRTYLMDVTQVESVVNSKTTCILPVHLYGQCVNMDAVRAVAARHGLAILEDCAQCHGAKTHGRRAGAMSDAAAFSFYPTKVLGGYGDGDMVLSDSEATASRVRSLRSYGMKDAYYSLEQGFNCRLDELHAEILRRKLKRLDQYIERRRQLARRYDQLLADTPLVLPCERPDNVHVYYLYVVRHARRDEIMAKLKEREIHVNVSYRWPVHTMSGFDKLGYRKGDLPETEAAADEIFSLPMYPSLTDDEQTTVCDVLHEMVRD